MNIVVFPDQILKSTSSSVDNIDENLVSFVDEMIDIMHHENGIGLAAVQIAKPLRIITMDIMGDDTSNNINDKIYHFINPAILSHSDELSDFNEGCLSFPKQRVIITRPKMIEFEYYDINSKYHKIELDGIAARCIQHEMDHLNGITIADRVDVARSQIIKDNAKKIKKNLNRKHSNA